MSITRGMDKEAVRYIYIYDIYIYIYMIYIYTHNGILLNHKREHCWMNLESVIQNKVSQKENQLSCINAYIWNLEKQY